MINITIDHYTENDMRAVCRTAGNNSNKIKATKIFILISIAVIITGFFIPSENIGTKFVCWGAVLLFFSIVSLIQRMFTMPAEMLLSARKTQKNYNNSPVYVYFNENNWSISVGTDIKSTEEILYVSTYGAEETDSYFFMSRQKNEYFCIPKRCFTYGTPDELRQLLTEKLGNKFKIKSGK